VKTLLGIQEFHRRHLVSDQYVEEFALERGLERGEFVSPSSHRHSLIRLYHLLDPIHSESGEDVPIGSRPPAIVEKGVIDVAYCAFSDERGFGQPQVFERTCEGVETVSRSPRRFSDTPGS
jgi:hypothetical protein